ncbi:PREDICTED: endogenous retrovirus group K member 9 Pol protein-like [Bison bison bison]|uniref:Endogenous retrovirus group K member 9 Pol protein-like n=1 Tax=Bison bison bison TaxID=43346 RepID=A0A6P3I6Z6_BISBB|nr:PREDICTED: endogenous retrovirus group K member 9 Pol protein-like [Bison bison bison]
MVRYALPKKKQGSSLPSPGEKIPNKWRHEQGLEKKAEQSDEPLKKEAVIEQIEGHNIDLEVKTIQSLHEYELKEQDIQGWKHLEPRCTTKTTGKLIKGPSSSPTTKGRPKVMTLQAATSKSACIDIPSPYDMELIELYNPHKIPTGYYGLIPPGTMGLILGRSSCTMRGLMVLTGVMDKDYEGEIHIMVNVMKMGNVYLQKREHFAQLLLLPYVKPMKASDKVRQGGFGSTNLTAALFTLLKEHRKPMLTLRIQGKNFTGMLETGANISIIRAAKWPLDWDKVITPSRLLEVNEANATQTFVNASYLQMYGPNQIVAYLKPYITNIPINLWGWDFLEQMKATISLNEPFNGGH